MESKELFLMDLIPRILKVEMPEGELNAEDIKEESLKLEESICSEETLHFGCCEASIIRLSIINAVVPMTSKKIKLYLIQGENSEFKLGEYKVYSDKPTADRRYRDIVAYDAMYDILKADVSEWYNTILPNDDCTVTLKEFRDSFFAYFGIEQEELSLVNDSMIVTKTIEPSQLSGKTVITAICEINGCFGHIGRNGKFQYVYLKEMVDGLYPADTLYPRDDLYPADPMNAERISKSHYISAEYEDYATERITKLQIRQEENDIGCIYGTGDNCYIVQDNFLVYGKSTEELTDIAEKMYSVISRVWYRPAHVEAKGNPCLEVGDGIRLSTKYAIVYTYILQRTLKGIQALRDTYDAEGEQYQSEQVNSVRDEIIQLKGKANKLTRTIEETKSEIVDIEKGLLTKIQQNAEGISLEAQRALKAEGTLSSQVSINAQQILLKVSKDGVVSAINQTAESIKIQAQKIDLEGLVNADELVSKFATITTLNATKAELEEVIAKRATLDQLNASNARISSLEVDHVSVNEFNATTANLENLIAEKIDATTVKAQYMEVANWTSSGYIKASKIDVDSLFAQTSIESTTAYFKGLHVAKLWDSTGTGLKTCWKYDSNLGWYISGTQGS